MLRAVSRGLRTAARLQVESTGELPCSCDHGEQPEESKCQPLTSRSAAQRTWSCTTIVRPDAQTLTQLSSGCVMRTIPESLEVLPPQF